MKYFINYASGGFLSSQREGLECAKRFGFEVLGFSENDIDDKFKQDNKSILLSKRGAGYWLWKPYIILKMMEKIKDGDYLVYMDSGAKFVSDPSQYLELIDERGILAFSMMQKTYKWTKGDCFYHINDEDKLKFANENQLQGTYIFFKKTDFSLNFVKKWLNLCLIDGIITDDSNKFMQNLPGFIEHRHDQAIFSLLCYNLNVQNIPQIDQFCVEHGFDLSRKIIERHGIRS